MHINSKHKHMYVNTILTNDVVTEELTVWTTKAEMSAAKLNTAQGDRLTHLQIQNKCYNY